MRERMLFGAVLWWCALGGGEVEAGGIVNGAASCSPNVVTVAPAATFAVPTIVSSVVTPSVTTVVPQAVVVSPTVTVPSLSVVPQTVVTPLVVRQRVRVQSVPRLGLRSLLCR